MAHTLLERILITNDDGLDAPGLEILKRAAESLAEEVWVVAPATDQSGVATSISLQSPLRIDHKGERCYAVSGTPTDCVAVAVRHLMKETPPDLVLSGINRGANVGAETSYSGTIGGALAALVLKMPAMALSQAFTDNQAVPWETAQTFAADTIAQLYRQGWPADVVLNVNFPDVSVPHVKPLSVTRQGAGALEDINVIERVDARNRPYFWLKIQRTARENDTSSETHQLEQGHITVSPIGFDRTNAEAWASLRTSLEG
ncbi:5'-nucleotidase SurE [Halomonadaceae bacterium LMG 33818]|uniref:5'/3'-nucleotidase SurE n=1 Tax=Cernens ardua TaxID=3402176 RepID=UPI003EDC729C